MLRRTTFALILATLPLAACGNDDGGTDRADLDSGTIITPDADAGTDAIDGSDATPPRPWRLVTEPGPTGISFADCLYASPLFYASPERGDQVIITGGDMVVGVDSTTQMPRWSVELPEQDGLRAFAAATPALHDGLLVVGYALRDVGQTNTVLDGGATGNDAATPSVSHWMVVVDVENGRIDPRFEPVELRGSVPGNDGGTVTFLPANGFLRSEIGWWGQSDDSLGYAYATFGNVRDIQPWHGWVFELDLDAWSQGGQAISAVFATTPEEDCGAAGASGSFQRLCGGGLWSPSGSIAIEADNDAGFDLIVAPGNGQLDLNRNDYANTLMRIPPGLDFDPGCDETLCADFDSDEPSRACVESCTHLFVPRLRDDEEALVMPDGRCDGLAFFECWATADYIGGSTPLLTTAPGGERVLVYPTKDGHAYLVDADHLGTMYDRHQLVNYCGTVDDPCIWSWSGMIVSEPVETTTLDVPRILVSTFMPDRTNPAGVVAVSVVDDGDGPRLERMWEFPAFTDEAAVQRFRRHPSRVQLAVFNGLEVAIVVEAAPAFERGTAYILRASDGALLAEVELAGPGYRFTQPLVVDDLVYVNSCDVDSGPGTLETIRMIAEEVTQ